MMKTQIVILTVVAAFLLWAMVAMAQPGNSNPSMGYTIEARTISGGNYHLTNPGWRVQDTARGGGYQLWKPSAVSIPAANGCCCTYLPLILRN